MAIRNNTSAVETSPIELLTTRGAGESTQAREHHPVWGDAPRPVTNYVREEYVKSSIAWNSDEDNKSRKPVIRTFGTTDPSPKEKLIRLGAIIVGCAFILALVFSLILQQLKSNSHQARQRNISNVASR